MKRAFKVSGGEAIQPHHSQYGDDDTQEEGCEQAHGEARRGHTRAGDARNLLSKREAGSLVRVTRRIGLRRRAHPGLVCKWAPSG